LQLFCVAFGSVTLPGTDPDRFKVNQDAFFGFNIQSYDKKWTVVGVMDGHGVKGHMLTKFLADKLPERIEQLMTEGLKDDDKASLQEMQNELVELGNADPKESMLPETELAEDILQYAFHLAHLDARRDPKVPADRSGTTCAVCVIDKGTRRLYFANVGDSRAILSDSDGIQTTQETTTSLSSERERIQQCNGRIDSNGNVFYGPQGIAMTRSLGNAVMLRAGILPTPIVTRYNLTSPCHVILGTDGVFDVLSNNFVVNLVKSSNSVQTAAETVAQEARKAWQRDLPIEVKVDDITCVVIECQ